MKYKKMRESRSLPRTSSTETISSTTLTSSPNNCVSPASTSTSTSSSFSFSPVAASSQSGTLYQQHSRTLHTPELSPIPGQSNYYVPAENPVALQHDYGIALNTSTSLMGSNPPSYHNEQFTMLHSPSPEIFNIPFNHLQPFLQQMPQTQHPVCSSANQFPHLVSALRAEHPIARRVYDNASDESSEGATASSNTHFANNHSCSWQEETRYQQQSSSECGARVYYDDPQNAYIRREDRPSCAFQYQTEEQMSSFASCSARPVWEECNFHFPEIPNMDTSWQEDLTRQVNQMHLTTEENNWYSEVTTRLCLFDSDSSVEELIGPNIQNETDVQSGTNTSSNKSTSDTSDGRGENTSTTFPPKFFDL